MKILRILAVFAVIALTLIAASDARAGGITITVTSLADNGGAGDLRAAINAADANSGSTINFESGLSGVVTLESALPQITVPTTITGPGATVISINGAGGYRPFYISNSTGVVSISGVTIENGIDQDGSGGAGVYVASGSSLTLSGCTITGNGNGSDLGGGVFNDGTVTISNCVLTKNSGSAGGALYNDNIATVTGCTLTDNTSPGGGGALFDDDVFGPTALTVSNSTVSGNSAATGAGIYNSGYWTNVSTVTVTGSTVSSNTASGNGGGISNGSTISMTNCVLSKNAGAAGGAMYNDASATLAGCTISDNSASSGGGIFNDDGGVATLTLTACKLSLNTATSSGGAIVNTSQHGPVSVASLTNCAVYANTSDSTGGGVYNSASATLMNCTVTGNAATTSGGGVYEDTGGSGTITNSILYGDTPAGSEIAGPGTAHATYCDVQVGETGTGNINSAPLFVDATSDLHLEPASPCYKAGTATGTPTPPTTTLDGYPRPNPPSMGAYELEPPPTGLTATAGNAQVALSWKASSGATSYDLYRGTIAGGESNTPDATGITTTAFTDTGLTNGTTYYYKVASVNVGGPASLSNEASATPEPPIPPVPTGLTATGGTGRVVLSWNPSTGATSYDLYRSTTSGGEGTTVYQTSLTPTFTDTSVAGGVTYYYTVAAVNVSGTSAQSGQVSAITAPAVPTGLAGKAGNAQAALTWTASAGAASYSLYRSTTTTEGTTAYKTVTTTSYTDTGLTNGTPYYYTISAANTSGTSAQSPEVEVIPTGAPLAPTGVVATAGVDQVTVSWVAATTATSYQLFRSTTSGGEGATVYQTSLASPYTDTAVSAGITYYYTVAAVNGGGTSPQSTEVHATPIPLAPTGVTVVAGNGEVTVSWTASVGAASYNVNWLVPGWTAYRLAKNTTALTYTQTGLSNGTAYSFEVAAVDAGGTSPSSTPVTATPLATPAGLTATPANAQVTLTWAVSAGATGYNVYRGTTTGGESAVPVGLAAGTPYTDTGLTDGVKYYYKIAGVNASGTSSLSAEVGATPLLLPPTGLTATAGDTQVTLAWTASIGATSYSVYRGTAAGGEGSTPVKSAITGTTYLDTGLTNGKTYYYKVAALNAAMTSALSTEVHATPVGLAITTGSITINWTTNLPASAVVNYGTSATALTSQVSSPASTTQSITLTGLTLGQIYYYQVVSTDAAGNSVSMPVSTFTP